MFVSDVQAVLLHASQTETDEETGCKILSTNAYKGMQIYTVASYHWQSYGIHTAPAKKETELARILVQKG